MIRVLVLLVVCSCSGGGSGGGPVAPGAPPGGSPPAQPEPPSNPAPVVTIQGDPQIPANEELEARIEASDESGLTAIEVAWGDGQSETVALDGAREAQIVLRHLYDRVAAFGITVTAVDLGGATGRATHTVVTRGGSLEVILTRAANTAPLLFSARVTVTGVAGFPDRMLADGTSIVFQNVVPGTQEVTASESTAGCRVSGEPSRSAIVDVGETASVAFELTCPFTPVERILYQRLVVVGAAFLDNIHTARPDGSEQMQLTNDGGNQFPVWSPDGSRIAWHGVRTAGPQIWIMNWDGSEQRRLTDQTFSSAPSWSADGRKIAFQSSASGSNDIWTIDLIGGEPIRLTSDAADETSPHWSRDGLRIAFTAGGVSQEIIHVMNSDGTARRSLGVSGTSPAWSPDGTRLTFYSRSDEQIWVVNADGSGAVRITDLPTSTGAPAFSPDGRSVIFHAPRTGNESRLWIVGLDGSDPRLLAAVPDSGAAHATWFAP